MALYNLNFGDLNWRQRLGVTAAVVVGLAAVSALIVASVGLFLILLPFAIAAVLIGRWRLRKMMNEAMQRQAPASGPRTIEADYRVVEDDERR